jgi:hypothetical protein
MAYFLGLVFIIGYTMKNIIGFSTLFFSIITLSALIAHLLALPAKMRLSAQDYLTVQGIYRGWAWLGVFELAAIVLVLIWTIQEYHHNRNFAFLFTAGSCLIVSIAIFFLFTFPANRATHNWLKLPLNWPDLRRQWEYSHAVRALLNLASVSLLLTMLLKNSH